MSREKLLQFLIKTILSINKDTPILVGIDGINASGKTFLADELAGELSKKSKATKNTKSHEENIPEVIRASLDGFHQPLKIRYAKGENSPEGYFSVQT